MDLYYEVIKGCAGPFLVVVDEEGALVRTSFLTGLSLDEVLVGLKKSGPSITEGGPALEPALTQLTDYFSKKRTRFELALKPEGTPFQHDVWAALRRIPYGTCRTYGQIARELGNPGAGRAVGLANNRNPIPIVIPCHRVIGNKGRLTGFGGGMENKLALLRLEGYFLL